MKPDPDGIRILCSIVGLVPVLGAVIGFMGAREHETMLRYLYVCAGAVAVYLFAMFALLGGFGGIPT